MRAPLLALLWLAACGIDPCGDFVEDATVCYDESCAGELAGTSVCECWDAGMDIDVDTCACVTLDLAAACDVYDMSEYKSGDFDCAGATAAAAEICAVGS